MKLNKLKWIKQMCIVWTTIYIIGAFITLDLTWIKILVEDNLMRAMLSITFIPTTLMVTWANAHYGK